MKHNVNHCCHSLYCGIMNSRIYVYCSSRSSIINVRMRMEVRSVSVRTIVICEPVRVSDEVDNTAPQQD